MIDTKILDIIHPESIVLVTDTLCDANGVSRFIQDITKIASAQNHRFYAVASTQKCSCQLDKNIIVLKPFLTFKMPFYPELDLVIPPFLGLYRTIKNKKPDMIHISTPGFAGFGAVMTAKWLKIPLMGTYHTDFPSYIYCNTQNTALKKITQWYERQFYKNFQGLFIRSEEYRAIIRRHLNFQDSQIHTIPAGIDTTRFDKKLRDVGIWARYQLPTHGKKALYVGRMTREKNIPFLIDVWIDLFDAASDAWLILIGSGSLCSEAKKYEQYNIRFLGHKEGAELATLYASSDFFVFPSTTDTLGQVVIEALSSALPAVVSDRGGPQSMVGKNFFNGFVCKANDNTIWKKAITAMLNDEALLEHMSHNAALSAKELSITKSFDFFWEAHTKHIQIDSD